MKRTISSYKQALLVWACLAVSVLSAFAMANYYCHTFTTDTGVNPGAQVGDYCTVMECGQTVSLCTATIGNDCGYTGTYQPPVQCFVFDGHVAQNPPYPYGDGSLYCQKDPNSPGTLVDLNQHC